MLFIEVVSSIQSRQCTLLHSEDSLCASVLLVIQSPADNRLHGNWMRHCSYQPSMALFCSFIHIPPAIYCSIEL